MRDLLLGREPKDFDVATDATPEQIAKIFRNARLIGRRFRLAHIRFGRDIIEVATFRGSCGDDRVVKNGRVIRDNVYGTIEQDAWRRDFTVNALYYNFSDSSVVDFVGGMADHRGAILCLIGDPEKSYREDPVRMLRAVRFATKLGFNIHPSCATPIRELSYLLNEIPQARLYDEVLKLFLCGYAVQTFEQLRHHNLFEKLFPETENCLAIENEGFPLTFLAKALENTDKRIAIGKSITPYFLFAALLWEPVRSLVERKTQAGENEYQAFQQAMREVIVNQVKLTGFPRRAGAQMREVWGLQPRFQKTVGYSPFRVLSHPRFRAAYDFLVLRAATGEADPKLADWWTKFQEASEAEQKIMAQGNKKRSRKRRRSSTRVNHRNPATQSP